MGTRERRGPDETVVLVAADARWVREQVRSAFVGPGQRVVETTRGQEVREAVATIEPDLVILDLQIGNMGGIAVAIDLRLEEAAGRSPATKVLLLLDRPADRVIAQRADADALLVKPVDAGSLRRAAKALLEPVTPAAAGADGTDAADRDEPVADDVADDDNDDAEAEPAGA